MLIEQMWASFYDFKSIHTHLIHALQLQIYIFMEKKKINNFSLTTMTLVDPVKFSVIITMFVMNLMF